MAEIKKVIDPSRIVTDPYVLCMLAKQGFGKDRIEFHKDYSIGNPTTKIYRDTKTGLYVAVCQGLPKVNADGARICGNSPNETTVGWQLEGGLYRAKPNIFTCSVDGIATELISLGSRFTKRGQSVGWESQVYLNGVEQFCGAPTVLLIDPTNSNYHDNVMEWDYGCCVRRLRQIEGFISDLEVVYSNPHGEIRVKLNQSGDLRLTLSGAVDAEGKSLGRVEGDEEIVTAEEFDKAVYPVTIGASLTRYSTSSDGQLGKSRAPSWISAHDTADGDEMKLTKTYLVVQTNTEGIPVIFDCYRSYLFFGTSALGAGAIVSAATLSLYGYPGEEFDPGHADLGMVEGVQHDPLEYVDHIAHRYKTTLGIESYYAYPLATDAYTSKSLNATGIGWINKTGTTKFCLKLKGDIANLQPGGKNSTRPYACEKGAGFQPKLVITYTAGTAYNTMVGNPTSWAWEKCDYGAAEQCPVGSEISWIWKAPTSGGPDKTPQGAPTSFSWESE